MSNKYTLNFCSIVNKSNKDTKPSLSLYSSYQNRNIILDEESQDTLSLATKDYVIIYRKGEERQLFKSLNDLVNTNREKDLPLLLQAGWEGFIYDLMQNEDRLES